MANPRSANFARAMRMMPLYAEIVFADINSASIGLQTLTTILMVLMGAVAGLSLGTLIMMPNSETNEKNNNQEPLNLQETIKTICGERDALVTSDGVQCLDENKNKAQAEEIQ